MNASSPRTLAGKIAKIKVAKPRKSPSCGKCERPKLGHPRSGCPSASDALVSATARLKISFPPASDDKREKNLRRPFMTHEKLVSQTTIQPLSRTSSMIVKGLLLPGIAKDGKEKKNVGESILIEQAKSADNQPEEQTFTSAISDDRIIADQKMSPVRLSRTASAEQMDRFIAALCRGGKDGAIALLISQKDVPDAVRDAGRRGLFTSVNWNTGLLIVGRERVAVNEMRKRAEGRNGSFMKGMVMGSALTWAGLAYT